jgi:hypothetical protein
MTPPEPKPVWNKVGAPGFEPGTSCPPDIVSALESSGVEWRDVANLPANRHVAEPRFPARGGFEAFGQLVVNGVACLGDRLAGQSLLVELAN